LALVGDAAFCPSLLAGQGSVLAGELAGARRSPEETFRRYERLLHPFMLTKQNAAEKFASSFAPKTRLGLFARNQVTKVLGVPFVTRRVMGSTLPDRINLTDYSENTGPQ
jgi:2-polyprenyl-6-methoxyphenol hydroxylase-like FAD-dependent oxidoreductase